MALRSRLFCFANVAIAFAVLSWRASAQVVGNPAYAGCGTGPYTSCTNQIPATYLSGSWIEDDSASEWTLTGNNGAPDVSGSVTGSVLVFPIAPGCPVINYTVASGSSSFAPAGTSSSEGTTSFTWVATNPNPSGSCGGYTPVTQQTFSSPPPYLGIINKGNDTATGQYQNSGGSGPISLETNLVITPTGESSSLFTYFDPNGWGAVGSIYRTQLNVLQSLQDTTSYDPPDPNGNKVQGRQVYEAANGTPTDGCYNAAINAGLGGSNPTQSFAINGSVFNVGWNVASGNNGNANVWGPDTIGWRTPSVTWYQQNLPDGAFPCQAVVPQAMNIVNNIMLSGGPYGNQDYTNHTLTITLTKTSVTVQDDSLQRTLSYP